MLAKIRERRATLRERRAAERRHNIAMCAARTAHSKAVIYRTDDVTTDDVINLAYGAHGIHLTETEARDALAAELATYGRRLAD